MRPPLFVHTAYKQLKAADYISGATLSTTSSGAPGASVICYVPMVIPWVYPIRRLFLWNGLTAAGNVDVGLYSKDGVKLISSGSYVQVGTSVPQFSSVSYLLPAGAYYLAAVMSSTGTWTRTTPSSGSTVMRQIGLLAESAFPLPAVMTPTATAISTMPLIGFTLTESGF